MNAQVDAFLKKANSWREESEKLREIILGFPLKEELKWGKPCYSYEGSNILIIQGFKEYCALMFCKGALLKDAKRLLIKPGENTQAGRQLRFKSTSEIEKLRPVLKAYIKEAVEAQKAGEKVTYKETSEYEMPEELVQRFTEDPAFKKAFNALTPGRQRGYLLHFSAAKQPKTREARIEKYMPQIFDGKGMLDHPARSKPKVAKGGVVLLSGGNPQIAKGDGDAPVQAYIAAMPGWKSALGKRIDELVIRAVPKARKAVKWNSPFYGLDGWFLSFHVLTRCVKITFFKGASLKPAPPGSTEKSGESRWIDIHEDDKFDEAQMTKWIKQAAALPGWKP
jgi:uncharacterized protein YdeI (YjbR/CyaY-like superfamily)